MQLLYQKKPDIIQKNRSWVQQNFLKLDQISVHKSKNSKLFLTKITRNAAPLSKKPDIIQKNRSWVQQNFLKFDEESVQKSKNSKLFSTIIT